MLTKRVRVVRGQGHQSVGSDGSEKLGLEHVGPKSFDKGWENWWERETVDVVDPVCGNILVKW